MSKGMQLYQRDHFKDKLNRKLDPYRARGVIVEINNIRNDREC